MSLFIALLRGVNVGGNRKVPMAELRIAIEALGLAPARTLLNSGNVVFEGGRQSAAALEKKLEIGLAASLELRSDIHVRTAAEWKDIIAANPFPDKVVSGPSHYIVWCLKAVPTVAALDTLRAAVRGPEIFVAVGRQLYIDFGLGMADTKMTPQLMDSRLGTPGTGRNWNTVLKLAALTA